MFRALCIAVGVSLMALGAYSYYLKAAGDAVEIGILGLGIYLFGKFLPKTVVHKLECECGHQIKIRTKPGTATEVQCSKCGRVRRIIA